MGNFTGSPIGRGSSQETGVAYNAGYVIVKIISIAPEEIPNSQGRQAGSGAANWLIFQGYVRIWAASLSARPGISAAGSAPVMAPITMYRDEQEKDLPRSTLKFHPTIFQMIAKWL